MSGAVEEGVAVADRLDLEAHDGFEAKENAVDGNKGAGDEPTREDSQEASQQLPPSGDRDVGARLHKCLDVINEAMAGSTRVAKLQAQLHDLSIACERFNETSADQAETIERCVSEHQAAEIKRACLQAEMDQASAELQRLEKENEQHDEDDLDYHRKAEAAWKAKYTQCEQHLAEHVGKIKGIQARYEQAKDLQKTVRGNLARAKALTAKFSGKCSRQLARNEAMKKPLRVVVQLVADISRECYDLLPVSIRERLDNVPIDEMLELTKRDDNVVASGDSIWELLRVHAAQQQEEEGGEAAAEEEGAGEGGENLLPRKRALEEEEEEDAEFGGPAMKSVKMEGDGEAEDEDEDDIGEEDEDEEEVEED